VTRSLDILDLVSVAGDRDKPNEDRAGSYGDRVWVIDGATDLGDPLLPGGSDAAWIAAEANRLFFRHAHVADHRELVDHVVAGIAAAHARDRIRPPEGDWQWPNAAFVLAEVRNGGIDVCWLGDCRLIIETSGRLVAVGEDGAGEAREREMARRLAEGGGGGSTMLREGTVLDDLRRKRARLVAPGGPRVLGVCPDAAGHLQTARIEASGEAFGLMMSDGFSALELKYGRRSAAGMMAAAGRDGLAALALEIRRIEEREDPEGKAFPRFKRSDDATAVLFRVANAA
jgi:hypothetical protein